MFICNIFYKTWVILIKFGIPLHFLINLLQNDINVFHFTWIMSLHVHYLVKLEMLIAHVLPLSCYRKKLQNLFLLHCGSQICQVWIRLITVFGEYWKRRCTKYSSLIWMNWNSNGERSVSSWIMFTLLQPFVSSVIDSSRSVMRVLYTSCNISLMLLSNGFKSGGIHLCPSFIIILYLNMC